MIENLSIKFDSPHWDWFMFGCRKHMGHMPPCEQCIKEDDPDLIRLDEEIDPVQGYWRYYEL